jgi:hypothetical protein
VLGAANGGGARRLEHTKALEVTDIGHGTLVRALTGVVPQRRRLVDVDRRTAPSQTTHNPPFAGTAASDS